MQIFRGTVFACNVGIYRRSCDKHSRVRSGHLANSSFAALYRCFVSSSKVFLQSITENRRKTDSFLFAYGISSQIKISLFPALLASQQDGSILRPILVHAIQRLQTKHVRVRALLPLSDLRLSERTIHLRK